MPGEATVFFPCEEGMKTMKENRSGVPRTCLWNVLLRSGLGLRQEKCVADKGGAYREGAKQMSKLLFKLKRWSLPRQEYGVTAAEAWLLQVEVRPEEAKESPSRVRITVGEENCRHNST